MSKTENKSPKYINIHKSYLNFIDLLSKDKKGPNIVQDGGDLVRLAIIVAISITPDKKLKPKIKSELNRNDGARNYQSLDIDTDGRVTLMISNFTQEKDEKNYRKMEELANIGIELIEKKYYQDEKIQWKNLEDAIQKNE